MAQKMDLKRDFSSEFQFLASRSGGPGGQNVNKVNTKVELRFNIQFSQLLSDNEKQLILSNLSNKINAEGELIIVAQSERSQIKNKEKVVERFYLWLAKALHVPQKRVKTNPTRQSVEKRLSDKKMASLKKQDRKQFPGL